jgi:hypothetical protein
MEMNLFKKKTENTDTVVDFKNKTTNELVAEIHETFNTEVDRLLEKAGILRPLPEIEEELLNKAERLSSLGFSNTIEIEKARTQTQNLNKVKRKNQSKNKLVESINYFSQKYPLYKFITEDSVKKICQKYNLIYGDVNRYIGDVPDKNLKEIENFKLDEKDECWVVTYNHMGFGSMKQEKDFFNKEECQERQSNYNKNMDNSWGGHDYRCSFGKSSLEIVAPLKDFNTIGMEVENFKLNEKIEIPDPVVLHPVIYKQEKYYLIVTAWGEEAGDELVVNQNFN